MSTAIAIDLDKRSEKLLYKMAWDMPLVFVEAHKHTAEAMRKEFSGIMRNGGNPKRGVPKLPRMSRFTRTVKGLEGVQSFNTKGVAYKSPKLFDGKKTLIATNTKIHVKYVRGGVQHVGFVEPLQEWIEKKLEAESYPLSTEQRRMFHKRYSMKDVPQAYSRPARHIIEPWAAYLAGGHFAEVLMANFNRLYTKKTKTVYAPSSHWVTGNEIQDAFGEAYAGYDGTIGEFHATTGKTGRAMLNAKNRAMLKTESPRAIERANHGW